MTKQLFALFCVSLITLAPACNKKAKKVKTETKKIVLNDANQVENIDNTDLERSLAKF